MDLSKTQVKAIDYATEQPVVMDIENGFIQSIEPVLLQEHEKSELAIVAPGLIDLQINGYAGCDFNQGSMPEDLVGNVIRMLWREGVTTSYPTLITNSDEAITQGLEAIARACEEDPVAAAGIAGIHLEGPFISPHDGARGAHSLRYIKAPEWELFCRWQEAAGGRIRLLTLSPEWPGSGDFILRCSESGVTVSIGHTSAASEQIQEAVACGARMSTHLGNGAQLSLPRHPNYIWEQLAQESLWSCLIADGFHLPDQILKVVLKVKGDKAVLVSDAVSISGLAPGAYTSHIGGNVVLTPEGRLHMAENEQLLAGSAQMQLWGIEHLLNRGIASLADAWNMASLGPASCMNLSSAAGLSPGAPADFVLFSKEGSRLRVEQTFKSGECVFKRNSLHH
ncbi:N-acetylglucosamine-6-phosphate deacetylase [Paenibacillus marchantiophytorum]|nr:amidohydrolase family protein [Paenibacillus marchantiophytorum]